MALETFQSDWRSLVAKIDALDSLTPNRINATIIAEALLNRVRASFSATGREDLLQPQISADGAYVEAEAPAIAMFGGVSVDLSERDVTTLRDAMIAAATGQQAEGPLIDLVKNASPHGKPWEDGYALADGLLDDLEDRRFDLVENGSSNIRGLCSYLGITINEKALDTDSIRGVALAGDGFSPTIMINTSSTYNINEDGRRFTVAHELCHVLYDQSRARRLAHASGAWVAPGIEKRANAFAAWILMPPRLLQRYTSLAGPIAAARLREIANATHVADRALVEHLYNLDVISEYEREKLRRDLQT